ncbi:MAG: hypothetical protein WC356_01835 [Candidatus Micrarchaeia archaeon]|jgi:hypothetical protein
MNFWHYKQRNISLQKLGFKTYQEYLCSDLWRKIRRKVLGREKNICQICHKNIATQIHHHNYKYETLRGDKRKLRHLVAICGDCHKKAEFSDCGDKSSLPEANERMNLPNYKICPQCNTKRVWTDFENFTGTKSYPKCKSCRS